MTPNLARYIDKTVFVSIPTLFEDGVCRPYRLLGADLNGLWLQSEDLTQRLLPAEPMGLADLAPVVFVPFAQIAGVLLATVAAPLPSTNTVPADQEEAEPAPEPRHHKKSGGKR